MSNLLSNISQSVGNLKSDMSNLGQGGSSKMNFQPQGFFKDVMADVNKVQQQLLGPDYLYWKQINNPTQLGMSGDGSLEALAKNVAGLVAYTELLVQGGGPASKIPGPLGNKFFLKTGATCVDETGRKVDRYIYVNNVPTGNIPFISNLLNTSFPDFRGLVPGVIENIGKVNPFGIFQAFMLGGQPKCVNITRPVTLLDNSGNVIGETQQSNYVLQQDLQNMQGFQNMKMQIASDMPEGIVSKLFFAGFGGLLLYILYLIIYKTNKLNNK